MESKCTTHMSLFARAYKPSLYATVYANGDGDCAYHAVLAGLHNIQYENPPPNVRALRDMLLPHATNAVVASRIRSLGTWAENEEIALMAKTLGVCIAVWMATENTTQRRWIYFHYRTDSEQLYGLTQCDKIVFLKNEFVVDYATGLEKGMHYDTLIPISREKVIVTRDPTHNKENNTSSDNDGSDNDGSDNDGSDNEGSEVTDMEIDIDDALREETDEDEPQDNIQLENVLPQNTERYNNDTEDTSDYDDLDAMEPSEQFNQVRKLIASFEQADTFRAKDEYQRQLLRMRNPSHVDRLYDHPAYLTKVSAPVADSTDFELTANQRFLKKYMSPETNNRAVLLFHGVGVGKTCSAIQISENYRNYFQKRCLVILPGGLEDNFRKELFDPTRVDYEKRVYKGCSGQRYLDLISEWHRY